MRRLLILTLAFALLAVVSDLHADTLFLKNGQKFEGKVVRETPTHVFFKITGLGEQQFAKADILKIEKGESIFDQYESRRKALAKDDADGHFALGEWCETNNLKKEAKKEFEAAVAANPEHAGARTKLGFVRYEGEWLTKEKYAEVQKDLAAKEAAVLSGLVLEADPHEDKEALFSIGVPKDFMVDARAGAVSFEGPSLGGAKIRVEFELTLPDESLDAFAENTVKLLKKLYGDLVAKGDPADGKLLGGAAKLLAFGYSVDGVSMERREILMLAPEGSYRLCLSCREGYADRLKPFFDLMAASLKRLAKPAEITKADYGYACNRPDENYETGEHFNLGNQGIPIPPGSTTMVAPPSACILVLPGKKGDGKADPTSLETLRDSTEKLFPMPFQKTGERKGTVAGAEALLGDLSVHVRGPDGQPVLLFSGYYAVLVNGERYFVLLFLNMMNRMGPEYAKVDWEKFLTGFRLL